MFEQVFENLRTATESGMHMQRELFQKWVGLWPAVTVPPGSAEKILKARKAWTELVPELVKRQRETLEAQFSAGLKNIEEAFRLAQAEQPEELRARTVELWAKSFDWLRQTYEAHLRDFQAAVLKWTELVTKGAA